MANSEPDQGAEAVELLLEKLGNRTIRDFQSFLEAVEETQAEAELVEVLRRDA